MKHMDKKTEPDFWRDYSMNESRTFEQVYKLIPVKDKKYGLWDMMMHNLLTRNQHRLYPAEGSSKFLCTVGTHLINYRHYIKEDHILTPTTMRTSNSHAIKDDVGERERTVKEVVVAFFNLITRHSLKRQKEYKAPC
jgi:hypothetical protein